MYTAAYTCAFVLTHTHVHTVPVTTDRCLCRACYRGGLRGKGTGGTPGWTNGRGRGLEIEVRPGNKARNRNVNYIKMNRGIDLIEIVLRRRRTVVTANAESNFPESKLDHDNHRNIAAKENMNWIFSRIGSRYASSSRTRDMDAKSAGRISFIIYLHYVSHSSRSFICPASRFSSRTSWIVLQSHLFDLDARSFPSLSPSFNISDNF